MSPRLLVARFCASTASRRAGIYRNSGGANPAFTDIGAGLSGVYYSAAAWGDYDNDGDLDLVITGYNEVLSLTKLYRNSGGLDPTFSEVAAGLPGVYAGSTAWEDYDQDGDLDLLLAGETGSGRITRIYRNSGGANPVFADIGAGLPGVYVSAAAWGDYDNDGDPDLLLTGEVDETSQISKVYESTGGANPTFSDAGLGLLEMEYGSAAWADYDNDGDLDMLITGSHGSSYAISLVHSFCAPPDTPSNLSVSFNGTRGSFTWDASSDAETPVSGLTYNLRVGTAPGASDVLSPLADGANGYRRSPAEGNAGRSTSLELELPGPGPYYWTVQTIDGAFAGSAFAPEQGFGQSGVGESPATGNFALWCAGPNPFSSVTTLAFSQPAAGYVSLAVFDLAGRLVRSLLDGEMAAGTHTHAWDGRNDEGRAAPSGLYFVRLKAAYAEKTAVDPGQPRVRVHEVVVSGVQVDVRCPVTPRVSGQDDVQVAVVVAVAPGHGTIGDADQAGLRVDESDGATGGVQVVPVDTRSPGNSRHSDNKEIRIVVVVIVADREVADTHPFNTN